MGVLVFAEREDGRFKKAALEAVTYGSELANSTGADCIAVTAGADGAEELGIYGASRVLVIDDARAGGANPRALAKALHTIAEAQGCSRVIVSLNSTGKGVVGPLAVKMDAGLVTGVVSLPEKSGDPSYKRSLFSGKAFATYTITSSKQVIGLTPNSIEPIQKQDGATVEVADIALEDSDFPISVKEVNKVAGTVPLGEAEIVVSGGRGLKGPENWNILEELATEIGAAMACSRPVADSGWRPHHEHVGQTGGTIRPNLYVAVGISGAIQHLAGVNQSKCIVVINKDPEAPFFKAADYGIVGDAFEVLPKLTAAARKFKSAS